MRFDLEKYDTVESRLEKFWGEHPNGRVECILLSDPNQLDECVVRAEVYFDASEPRPRGVGHAFERRGGGGANQTSHLENAETSAIGRALANCGYKARKDSPRPSQHEMRKANGDGQQAPRPQPQQAPRPQQPTPPRAVEAVKGGERQAAMPIAGEPTGKPCPECNAPAGRPHSSICPNRGTQTPGAFR